MKKVSLIKAITLFLGVLLLTASLFQCTKVGDNIQFLDRTGIPDSTVYSPFSDNFLIATADVTPGRGINDTIKARGVQTIIHEYCGTSNCHGGPIKPKFDTYADIMKFVVAGMPEQSKLWELITTNDFNRAMPPVNNNIELSGKDKSIIYNWIRTGAKEKPNLADFRPAAIRIIADGCGSANCHNQATVAGSWAEKGTIGTRYNVTTTDTASAYLYLDTTGVANRYCQFINKNKLGQIWNDYRDSVRRYYSDTINNASFRIVKTFTTNWTTASRRGPLGSYEDIIMDIIVPKSVRSGTAVIYTDPVTGTKYYSKSNHLNSNESFLRQVDSSLRFKNPETLVWNTGAGDMAWKDGGLSPSEIALIKAWYFADPNIPDVWKYGKNNEGIFKNNKSGNLIIKR